MLVKKNNELANNFSFLVFLVNSKKRPLRKVGVFFYSKVFNKFVLHLDFFYMGLLFRDGVNLADFFFNRILLCVNSICFAKAFDCKKFE